ncbi:MAG: hypothetical protein JNN12_04345 [Bacteroidetes Order II. Incertae sedis bacterium]|nr:hypothetical protein [Bacteroidetes Order II. bacterium]
MRNPLYTPLLIFWLLIFVTGCKEKPVSFGQKGSLSLPDYEVISETETPMGKAVALLVPGIHTKEAYVGLVKAVVTKLGPSNLQIYTSKAAFEAVKKPDVNDAYRKGFILVFRKEVQTAGEIWWMQEDGPLAALSGTVTRL